MPYILSMTCPRTELPEVNDTNTASPGPMFTSFVEHGYVTPLTLTKTVPSSCTAVTVPDMGLVLRPASLSEIPDATPATDAGTRKAGISPETR